MRPEPDEPPGLHDRAALNRLADASRVGVGRDEDEAAGALYPKRSVRSSPHKRGARPGVPAGIDLAAVEALLRDAELPEGERARLLRNLRELADHYTQRRR